MVNSSTGPSSTSSSAFSHGSPESGSDAMSSESSWNQRDPLALHKGFEAIATSLSLLTNTLGMALEEQRQYAKSKVSDAKHKEQTSDPMKASERVHSMRQLDSPSKLPSGSTQMKAPQELTETKYLIQQLAIAMTTKAKLLLRELKGVKQDLIFSNDRCSQLEEENKCLRESIDKGVRQEEDDLVRLQLEALLAEKARLAQENATYARDIQYLHEVVQYQQLKLRELAISDEGLTFDDELNFDAEDVAMDLLPLYQDENENNNDRGEALSMVSHA